MKALVYTAPEQLQIQERPIPQPAANEVRIKISYCGICGSDVHGYLGKTGRRIPPMVMGHEFSGVIDSVGGSVTNFSIGQPVTVEPLLFCGNCEACRSNMTNMCIDKAFLGVFSRDGAMMEYICVPQQYVVPLSKNIPLQYGAAVEALAVGYRGSKQAGDLRGKNVLIIGAGTIGLMTLIFVLRQKPAAVVVSDLSDARLKIAASFGAGTVNPSEESISACLVEHFGQGQADVTIEVVGSNPTVRQSIDLLKNGGTSVWIGNSARIVEVPMQEIVTRELTIHGTNVYTMQEFCDVAHMLETDSLGLEKLISAIVPIEEASAYFEKLAHNPEDLVKVLIKM